jgi:hypothetical protein
MGGEPMGSVGWSSRRSSSCGGCREMRGVRQGTSEDRLAAYRETCTHNPGRLVLPAAEPDTLSEELRILRIDGLA